MTIKDFFFGKLTPLKFKVGDMVKYEADCFADVATNGYIYGQIVGVDQVRGLPNRYVIVSESLLDHKKNLLRVSVCESKIKYYEYYHTIAE